MTEFLYHYLWLDMYVPIWPNIAASAILAAWALRKFVKIEKLHRKNHQAQMEKMEAMHDAIRSQKER